MLLMSASRVAADLRQIQSVSWTRMVFWDSRRQLRAHLKALRFRSLCLSVAKSAARLP